MDFLRGGVHVEPTSSAQANNEEEDESHIKQQHAFGGGSRDHRPRKEAKAANLSSALRCGMKP